MRTDGLRKTLAAVVRRLVRPVVRQRNRLLAARFDRARGIDTGGIGSARRNREFEHYEATLPKEFERLLRPLDIDVRDFTYVDLGCGKGRTLVLAIELGFKRIIGVEFDPELARVAQANVAVSTRTVRASTEIVVLDAAEYVFPDEPLVVYFYNPFRGATMQRVLENLHRSLTASPRPVFVVYYVPISRDKFDASGFLDPIHVSRRAVVYRASVPEPTAEM